MPRHTGRVRNHLTAVTDEQINTVSQCVVRVCAGRYNHPDPVGVLLRSEIGRARPLGAALPPRNLHLRGRSNGRPCRITSQRFNTLELPVTRAAGAKQENQDGETDELANTHDTVSSGEH